MRRLKALLVACAVALLSACPTVRNFQRLDSMTDSEYSRFVDRFAAQARVAVSAALEEQDITPEAVLLVADTLEGLAKGTTAGGVAAVVEAFDLEGYAEAALALSITEFDAELEDRGAYAEDGMLSERGRGVLEAIAETLRSAAEPPA